MEVTASMASTVLGTVLGSFKDVIKSEIARQQGLQADLAFMEEELEMMQAFVTASDEGRGRDEVVNVWVKHVSKLANDVEYCLSRFAVHLNRSFLPRHLCMLLARHDIGKEVRELKARVEDVSKRSLRYRLSDDNSPSAAASFRIDDKSQYMAGVHLLQQLITKGADGLQVIAVWSTSEDAGKTSIIIKEAYDHQDICDSFQYRAWIKLGSPFNEEELVKCMVTQFIPNYHQAHGGRDMKYLLEKYVSNSPYLIVIDGISTIMEWHQLRTYLPDKNNRSRIVVSTREEAVATFCVGQPYKVLEADRLSSKASIKLVFKKDYQRIGSCSSHNSVETVFRWIASVREIEEEAPEGSSARTSRGQMVGRKKEKELLHDLILEKSFSSTIDQAEKPFPSTIDQAEKPFPSTIDQAEKPFPSTIDQVEKPFPSTIDQAEKPFPSTIDQAEKLFLSTIDQAQNPFPTPPPVNYYDMPTLKRPRVISVWGPRGVGKTALVGSMLCELSEHFVVLPPMTVKRPFSRQEFFQSLIDSLDRERVEGKSTTSRFDELNWRLSSYLSERRYLLVLYGLSCTWEFDEIVNALPDSNNGSCIVATTRKKEVAEHCSRLNGETFELEAPDIPEALDIFYNKVYRGARMEVPQELEEEAKDIVEQCGRIPLSVATIGAFLSTRPKTTAEWRKCIHDLSSQQDNYAKAFLVCVYHSLSFRERICLLYLSIFPQGIRGGRLVRRWIAEGYAIAREMTPTATALAVGKDYIAELIRKELIQRSTKPTQSDKRVEYTKPTQSDKRVEYCRVNPLIQEMALSNSMEENLVFVVDNDSCSLTTTKRTVRHLAVCRDWKRVKKEWVSMVEFSRLQSLTISGEWKSFFISDSMRLLGVLDLEDASGVTDKDIRQIMKLIHLKYLSLRGCGSISRLPDSLGHLRHLQTLDIRDTKVKAMPRATVKLQALQHLRAGKLPPPPDGQAGVKIPAGIAGLMGLQTLGTISFKGATWRNLCAGEENILEELKELTKLRKLGVVGITPSNCEQLLRAVATLRRLESLSLCAEEDLDDCLNDLPLLPASLERLKLHGKLTQIKTSVCQLKSLQKLTLLSTLLEHTSIPALGSLPILSILCLMERSYIDQELRFDEGNFPSLTMLQLARLKNVEKVLFKKGTMPKLELLYLYAVGASETSTCCGLSDLPRLMEVSVTQCKRKMGDDVWCQLQELEQAATLEVDGEKYDLGSKPRYYESRPDTCNIM